MKHPKVAEILLEEAICSSKSKRRPICDQTAFSFV